MKNGTVHWLASIPGRKKGYILALMVAEALQGASGVLYALLLRNIVDAAAGKDATGFWHGIIGIVVLVAIQLGLRAIIRWLTELGKSSFENIFKARLADTLLHKDYLAVGAVHSGEWMNRLTNDAKVVADHAVDILPGLAGMVVRLISALAMLIAPEPRFAAILIPGGLLLSGLTLVFRKVLKRLHKNVQEADGRLRVFLQERIGSLLMIRSFAAEKQTEMQIEEKMGDHQAARMRRNRFSNLCNIGFGAAMSGMYLLGVGWCGYGILRGTITFGTLTAVTHLISQIRMPFANITGYLPKYYAMLASAERLMEAESFPDDGKAEVLSLHEMQKLYETGLSGFGLDDVSFTYYPPAEKPGTLTKEGMPEVLKHISLKVSKGEYVAFTGQSGCGKSTALKLMMCIYQPDEGARYFKDLSGEEHSLTSAYRRLFAYVPQGNALMNGTIREVVSFAAPEAAHDDDRLWKALTIACADGFVSELEQGADTLLGERGTGLSEGQMQRISIARAIFSGSPVLLLDEATSALDASTEEKLLSNLRSMTDKTVIIVTHRSAALTICDRVMEFAEQGVIRHDQ